MTLTSPISSGEVLPGVAVQGAKEGAKASKKRHKQCRQEATTDGNGGIDERAGGSSTNHVAEAMSNSKHQAPSTKHDYLMTTLRSSSKKRA
jgi:hypothetical protein